MAPSIPETPLPQGNRPGARPDATLAHVAYGLYAASVLVGVTAIAGLLLCYIARRDVRATWIEGHYRWLIRGFWLYFLINLLGMALVFIGVGWLVLGLAMMWWIYRIAIGWLRLYRGEAIPDPASFI